MTSIEHAEAFATAEVLMMFQARRKSAGISYALWLFVGMLGAHRFYNDRPASAVLLIALTLLGFVTGVTFILAALWVLVDAFLIPGWIKQHNVALAERLMAHPSLPSTA